MRTFDVEAIANGAYNLSVAAARASSVNMTVAAADDVKKQVVASIKANLREHNITLHTTVDEDRPLRKALLDVIRPEIQRPLADARMSLEGAAAALPARFIAKIGRVEETIKQDDFDAGAVSALLLEIAYDLVAELAEPMFLYVAREKRGWYQQERPPFGEEVERAFPGSTRDVSAACRCYALDEWTACVFHLMRALECPLHKLAMKIGAILPRPLEYENWKNIIDKIDSEIAQAVKRLEATAASTERNKQLKDYGEVSTQLRHFKNAWRNDAAHGREHYDEREATRVFNAVREFMQMMAVVA